MPNTRHSKCVECHIKVANYLIQILQQDKLNSTQISKKKKKKPTTSSYILMRFL